MPTYGKTTRPKDTRGNILKTAQKIFARNGFAGARMDEIARQARVNKAMIYYHIGNKKALYAEVLHHIFSNALNRFKPAIDKEGSPEQKLRRYIQGIAQTVGQNPEVAAILMREQANGGKNFPDVIMKDMYEIILLLVEVLDQGRRSGAFVATNPFAVHMLAVGSILITHTSYPIRTRIPAERSDVEAQKQQPLEKTLSDIEALILRAVLKTPADAKEMTHKGPIE